MDNLDELNKLQELKESGVITQEEFETEKNKLLNSQVQNAEGLENKTSKDAKTNTNKEEKTPDNMKKNNKRKSIFTVVIAVIILAVVICVGVIVGRIVTTNISINKTETELSKINATELEEKLIVKLRDSKLNIDDKIEGDYDNYYWSSFFTRGSEMGSKDEWEDFVVATIGVFSSKSAMGVVQIPIFKIYSDSNGKFKQIEYYQGYLCKYVDIKEIISSTLKEEYGIDICKNSFWNNFNNNYNEHFSKSKGSGSIITVPSSYYEEMAQLIIMNLSGKKLSNITYQEINEMEDYETYTFGIEN